MGPRRDRRCQEHPRVDTDQSLPRRECFDRCGNSVLPDLRRPNDPRQLPRHHRCGGDDRRNSDPVPGGIGWQPLQLIAECGRYLSIDRLQRGLPHRRTGRRRQPSRRCSRRFLHRPGLERLGTRRDLGEHGASCTRATISVPPTSASSRETRWTSRLRVPAYR